MRPRLNAGDDTNEQLEQLRQENASMRPRLNAGDDILDNLTGSPVVALQ